MSSSFRMRACGLLTALAAFAGLIPSARATAGAQVWVRDAPLDTVGFGARVAGAGDVNGDGNEDILVSASTLPYGTIYVISGANGAILRTFIGNLPATSPALLAEAHSAGDFDGDGTPDFLLGARASSDTVSGEVGYAVVVSGKGTCDGLVLSADCAAPPDDCVLLRICGDAPGDTFGDRLAFAGDVDGDGVDDVLAGMPGLYLAAPGRARLYSGADASVLFSVDGLGPQDNLGYSVAGLGDVTGDGVPDFAIGAPGVPKKNKAFAGELRVYSGADFTIRKTIKGKPYDMLGTSVASAGLVNGDTVPDIVYGVPGRDRKSVLDAGQVIIASGTNGKKLHKANGTSAHLFMGQSVILLGDVDGDGVGDIAAGTASNGVNGEYGRVGVYSGSCGCGLVIFDGLEANDGTGTAVGAADVTGDGRAELIVGNPTSTSYPRGIIRAISLQ